MDLFFTFSGRIARGRFWIANLIYAAILALLALWGYASDQGAMFQGVNGILSIVLFISSLAVGIKRLHDRNKTGWYLLLFYGAPGVLVIAGAAATAMMDDASTVTTILGLLAFAIGVWGFVELGCLRGTIGVNPYGPDPVAPATVPPVRTPL